MRKRQVADFFNAYAGGFDDLYARHRPLYASLFDQWFRRSMKLRFQKTLESCAPVAGRSVLDIGCGPGHYAIALVQLGAARAVGLDFAENMVTLATSHAAELGLANRCRFVKTDFMEYQASEQFDYAVAIGLMDYVSAPQAVIERVLSVTRRRAMFSFPCDGGFLAWQRKLRYRCKCDLYMYSREQIDKLFINQSTARIEIEDLGRDFFVIAHMPDSDQGC